VIRRGYLAGGLGPVPAPREGPAPSPFRGEPEPSEPSPVPRDGGEYFEEEVERLSSEPPPFKLSGLSDNKLREPLLEDIFREAQLLQRYLRAFAEATVLDYVRARQVDLHHPRPRATLLMWLRVLIALDLWSFEAAIRFNMGWLYDHFFPVYEPWNAAYWEKDVLFQIPCPLRNESAARVQPRRNRAGSVVICTDTRAVRNCTEYFPRVPGFRFNAGRWSTWTCARLTRPVGHVTYLAQKAGIPLAASQRRRSFVTKSARNQCECESLSPVPKISAKAGRPTAERRKIKRLAAPKHFYLSAAHGFAMASKTFRRAIAQGCVKCVGDASGPLAPGQRQRHARCVHHLHVPRHECVESVRVGCGEHGLPREEGRRSHREKGRPL